MFRYEDKHLCVLLYCHSWNDSQNKAIQTVSWKLVPKAANLSSAASNQSLSTVSINLSIFFKSLFYTILKKWWNNHSNWLHSWQASHCPKAIFISKSWHFWNKKIHKKSLHLVKEAKSLGLAQCPAGSRTENRKCNQVQPANPEYPV